MRGDTDVTPHGVRAGGGQQGLLPGAVHAQLQGGDALVQHKGTALIALLSRLPTVLHPAQGALIKDDFFMPCAGQVAISCTKEVGGPLARLRCRIERGLLDAHSTPSSSTALRRSSTRAPCTASTSARRPPPSSGTAVLGRPRRLPPSVLPCRETTVKGIRPDDFQTEQVMFASADGTQVPMYIVRCGAAQVALCHRTAALTAGLCAASATRRRMARWCAGAAAAPRPRGPGT